MAFASSPGRRVGLITNRSARDSAGRRTVDVLHQAARSAACGAVQPRARARRVGRGQDRLEPRSGDRPADLQPLRRDACGRRPPCWPASTRWSSTCRTSARASTPTHDHGLRDGGGGAAASSTSVVLDRPEPDHGRHGGGAVLDADLISFITYLPLPVRHGMTIGELARLFNAERNSAPSCMSSPCAATQRSMWFDQTGFAWVAPSPNLRKLEQAVLYPGVGMAESRQRQRRPRHRLTLRADGRAVDRRQGAGRPVECPQHRRRAHRGHDLHARANGSIPARAAAASASPSPTATGLIRRCSASS